jgi:hypothetical protein
MRPRATCLRYNDVVMQGLSDTDPDTARVHLDLLRSATPERRLRLALSLSRSTMSLSRAALATKASAASTEEVGLRFAARLYGQSLADEVRAALAARRP